MTPFTNSSIMKTIFSLIFSIFIIGLSTNSLAAQASNAETMEIDAEQAKQDAIAKQEQEAQLQEVEQLEAEKAEADKQRKQMMAEYKQLKAQSAVSVSNSPKVEEKIEAKSQKKSRKAKKGKGF